MQVPDQRPVFQGDHPSDRGWVDYFSTGATGPLFDRRQHDSAHASLTDMAWRCDCILLVKNSSPTPGRISAVQTPKSQVVYECCQPCYSLPSKRGAIGPACWAASARLIAALLCRISLRAEERQDFEPDQFYGFHHTGIVRVIPFWT